MRALIAVLALLSTLLLGAIAVELYQIQHSLAVLSAPVRAAAAAAAADAERAALETPDERRARLRREAREFERLFLERLEAAQPNAPARK